MKILTCYLLNPIDIVVEAASQDAVKDVALSVLQNKKDLMIMSVGALLDESIYDILSDACKDFKKTIYLPSGAIAGLDGIKSVKDELESLSITTTKHPRSLKGAKFFETSEINLDDNNSSSTNSLKELQKKLFIISCKHQRCSTFVAIWNWQ